MLSGIKKQAEIRIISKRRTKNKKKIYKSIKSHSGKPKTIMVFSLKIGWKGGKEEGGGGRRRRKI